MHKTLCLILVFTFSAEAGLSQSPTLTNKQLAVKRKAQSLSPRARISVVEIAAPEEYGTFISSEDDSFTFFDIDRKKNVSLRYTEVKKIKDGYGGYNYVTGTHTDHTRALVFTLVVLVGLGVFIVAAAKS